MIDDSIVRGTTGRKIVQSLKSAGASAVHVRIASPPFLHACHYGTDINCDNHLIASRLSVDEIRQEIGADSLAYISLNGLKKACRDCTLPFCTVCFAGEQTDCGSL